MIGTHQSLTYAKPLQWYFKPFHFIAKCQERDYKEQYKLGVRLFDIRIKPYKGTWRVAHGSMIFDIDLYEVLRYLNSKGDCIIQISLEYNKEVYLKGEFVYFPLYFNTNSGDIFKQYIIPRVWTITTFEKFMYLYDAKIDYIACNNCGRSLITDTFNN